MKLIYILLSLVVSTPIPKSNGLKGILESVIGSSKGSSDFSGASLNDITNGDKIQSKLQNPNENSLPLVGGGGFAPQEPVHQSPLPETDFDSEEEEEESSCKYSKKPHSHRNNYHKSKSGGHHDE